MKLSDVYLYRKNYGIIYHLFPNSNEVEFVTEKFFSSKKRAEKWFNKHYKNHRLISPEIVEVFGIENLKFKNKKELK